MNKKYMFLAFFASLVMASCGGSDANTELEKEKLKLEREKLELEKSKATQAEPQSEGADESSKKEENNKEADEERRKEVAEKVHKALNVFQDNPPSSHHNKPGLPHLPKSLSWFTFQDILEHIEESLCLLAGGSESA